jgi:hypothetical protein
MEVVEGRARGIQRGGTEFRVPYGSCEGCPTRDRFLHLAGRQSAILGPYPTERHAIAAPHIVEEEAGPEGSP